MRNERMDVGRLLHRVGSEHTYGLVPIRYEIFADWGLRAYCLCQHGCDQPRSDRRENTAIWSKGQCDLCFARFVLGMRIGDRGARGPEHKNDDHRLNQRDHREHRTRTGLLALAAIGATSLAGCSGDDPDGTTPLDQQIDADLAMVAADGTIEDVQALRDAQHGGFFMDGQVAFDRCSSSMPPESSRMRMTSSRPPRST